MTQDCGRLAGSTNAPEVLLAWIRMGAWGALGSMRIWGLEASVRETRTFTNGLNKQKHAMFVIKKNESWDEQGLSESFPGQRTSRGKPQ